MKLNQLIIVAIKTAGRPLENYEIRKYVMRRRPSTSVASIDTSLNRESAKGTIIKTPAKGLGTSKNLYSVPKLPKVSAVLKAVLNKSKQDSMQLHSVVSSIIPNVTKKNVDQTLYRLVNAGAIQRSKNPMTDSNTISAQSKFLYSL